MPRTRRKSDERLFAEAVEKNPRWVGLPLGRMGNSDIVLPHPDTWVNAICQVCERPITLRVPPGEEALGADRTAVPVHRSQQLRRDEAGRVSRACTVCPRSRMPDAIRHLHELEEGARFTFPGEPDAFVVLAATPARSSIAPDRAAPAEKVAFTTRFRGDVEFSRPARSERPCAPSAMVVPL